MKRFSWTVVMSALSIAGCLSIGGGDSLDRYTVSLGAELEKGPLGYTMTATEGSDGVALRPVGPFQEELVCRFTLKTDLPDGVRNGFLVLSDQQDRGRTIVAGIYIGAREFAIEGSGVTEPITVPVDFDQSKEFEVTVIVNFKQKFVEMRTSEREIGTGLASHMQQISDMGYKVNDTRTHFSRVKISGK